MKALWFSVKHILRAQLPSNIYLNYIEGQLLFGTIIILNSDIHVHVQLSIFNFKYAHLKFEYGTL